MKDKPWFIKGSNQPIPPEVLAQHSKPSPETLEKFGKLEITQARMEEKLDNNIATTIEIKEMLKDNIEKNETRISNLEAWRNYLAGGMAMVFVFGGFVYFLVVQSIESRVKENVKTVIDEKFNSYEVQVK